MVVSQPSEPWLALAIGNSRWHCAAFNGGELQAAWERPPRQEPIGDRLPADLRLATWQAHREAPPVYLASVVPAQTVLWLGYPNLSELTLADVPLDGIYPTLGLDRALALYGAGETYGWPILVIDSGTALTLTGGDRQKKLVGGAILPGLSVQLRSLQRETAALGAIALPNDLPPLWSLTTASAIASGTIHSLLAGLGLFITDWWQQFPESPVVMTGGDGAQLIHYCQHLEATATSSVPLTEMAARLQLDPLLIFRGIQQVRGL